MCFIHWSNAVPKHETMFRASFLYNNCQLLTSIIRTSLFVRLYCEKQQQQQQNESVLRSTASKPSERLRLTTNFSPHSSQLTQKLYIAKGTIPQFIPISAACKWIQIENGILLIVLKRIRLVQIFTVQIVCTHLCSVLQTNTHIYIHRTNWNYRFYDKLL